MKQQRNRTLSLPWRRPVVVQGTIKSRVPRIRFSYIANRPTAQVYINRLRTYILIMRHGQLKYLYMLGRLKCATKT